MTQIGKLQATRRSNGGKGVARQLRREGLIPAVIYGAGGDNGGLSISPNEFRKSLDPEKRFNTFLTLAVVDADGKNTTEEPVIVVDYQLKPDRDDFLHVDFLRVDPEQEIETSIPVVYNGRPAGVALGGTLLTHRRAVRISVKPADIPVALEVDVDGLETGASLRISDMKIENARLLDPGNTLLANIDPPKTAKEGGEEAQGK